MGIKPTIYAVRNSDTGEEFHVRASSMWSVYKALGYAVGIQSAFDETPNISKLRHKYHVLRCKAFLNEN